MPTGLEEAAAIVAEAIVQGAQLSTVSNSQAALTGFAADMAAEQSCEPILSPEILEGDGTTPGECKSYDALPPEVEPHTAEPPVTGDKPMHQPVPSSIQRVSSSPTPSRVEPSPEDFDDRSEASIDDTPQQDERPWVKWPSAMDIGLAGAAPIFGQPIAAFVTTMALPSVNDDNILEDVFDWVGDESYGETTDSDIANDLAEEIQAAEQPIGVSNAIVDKSPLGPTVRRMKKILAASAMEESIMTSDDVDQQNKVILKESVALVVELAVSLIGSRLMAKMGKPPPKVEPSPRPLPPAEGASEPRARFGPLTQREKIERFNEGSGRRSSHLEGVTEIPAERPNTKLSRIGEKLHKGIFKEDGKVVVTKISGSANSENLRFFRVQVEKVNLQQVADRAATARARRAVRAAGLIDDGYDAGHGVGRAIGMAEDFFNYFNEGSRFNRVLKNRYAEGPVRDWLTKTDRQVDANLTIRSWFDDVSGNPTISKTRIQLTLPSGEPIVDVAIDAKTGQVIDNLNTAGPIGPIPSAP